MTGAKVHADVEDDDDEDKNDVTHEPHVDLLEVGSLGQVFLDGCQQRGQDEKRGQCAHESVSEKWRPKTARSARTSEKFGGHVHKGTCS